jgi:hypothetical protein
VVGLALPIVKAASGETTVGVFAYYSYELPFRKGP